VAIGLLIALLSALQVGQRTAAQASRPELTHGIASGEVTSSSAVIWARTSGPARLLVELEPAPGSDASWVAEASEATDYTAQLRLNGLQPETRYRYRIQPVPLDAESGEPGPALEGSFRTAPEPNSPRSVALVVGGDVGSQRYCRRVELGYPIFGAMADLEPDFFVANGDMIYADYTCPTRGPRDEPGWENVPGDFPGVSDKEVDWTDLAALREVYWRHWRYNRADPHLQRLLRDTPIFPQWDDHEVVSDFGAAWSSHHQQPDRAGYQNLVTAGRDAVFAYWPLVRPPDEPNRLYRRVRWGADLELFLLDTRSYRSRNDLPDSPEQAKTLLGAEQRAWLLDGLSRSSATWKLVATTMPISVPGGRDDGEFGRDGWANGTDTAFSLTTGYERELAEILRALDRANVANLFFVAADVHFAQILLHDGDFDGDGDSLEFYQLTTGPLNANPTAPRELDPTFQPTLLYAEGGLLNFGYIRIERDAEGRSRLIADVRGEDGQPRPGSRLELVAR
jgi:alkaline phosphatase D